jgi:hypothetical protein
MEECVLTLQLPRGNRFIPIAMTGNHDCLLFFKNVVLNEKQSLLERSTDEVEAVCARAELEKLSRVLDLLIPEPQKGMNNSTKTNNGGLGNG